MTRPAPRRPSRTTTPKPRKLAGKDATNESAKAGEPPERSAPAPPKRPTPDRPGIAGLGSRMPPRLTDPRLTRTLLVLVGVLVLLILLQGAWFLLNERRDADGSATARDTTSQDDGGYEQITVPAGHPVILDELAVQEGVEEAAAAAQIMFTRDYKAYDDGVENAVTLMTDEFAQQYRTTTDDVRRESIRTKTQVEVRVVAQSVVRANDAELEALVFLNQYTSKGVGPDATTTYTPYRAVVKMVHTDQGWLVDGVDTK